MAAGDMIPAPDECLTISEAAKLLGVSPWTLRNWDNSGKLKPQRHPVNGYRMYRREDLREVLNSGRLAGNGRGTLAPHFDWKEIGHAEHFVQFYETDDYLVECVSGFLATALLAGDAAVVFATASHRRRIAKKLKAAGVDVKAARRRGRYSAVDAEKTLSQIMTGDAIDSQRFQEVVGGTVARLAQSSSRLRAFGELVALLCARGLVDAAHQLENLWNDLAQQHSFAIYCAYPLEQFASEARGSSYSAICDCHSRVLPSESYAALSTSTEQLREIGALQQKAISLQAEIAQRERAERELADFVEHALEGLHKVGPDGRILWANDAELNLLGYSLEEYVGRPIAEFHVDQDVMNDILAKLLRGESVVNRPARLRCKDGAIKHVLIHSNAYFENGELLYTRCFTRDVTENVEAERDRALLAAIIESSEDAIVSKDLDGIITSWNSGAERLFGYTSEEVVGRPITLLIPEERHDEEPGILRRIRRGERIESYETVRRRKDGTLFDVSLSVSPVVDANGRIIGASKIARDITERKQAEVALRESENRFRRLVSLLPAGVYSCEAPSGVISFYNERAAELWGRRPQCGDTDERFCGSFKLWRTTGEFLPHDQTPMALAIRDGQTFHNEEVVVERPDGSRITALVNIEPVRDSDGHVTGAINVFQDMSALKEAERALREQRDDLATLLDTVPVGVVIAHDRECRQITGNAAATQLLGMSSGANLSMAAFDEGQPTRFRGFKDGEVLQLEDRPLRRATKGEIVSGEAIDLEFDDGRLIHTLVSARALCDADGRPRGAVGCLLDVTELKNAENALRDADRRKDEFLATLAHELRNPLAPIVSGLELLKMVQDDPVTLEEVRSTMERQTRQLTTLVDDLLDVSRITRGKLELRKSEVALSDVIRTAVEGSRPPIDEAEHRLTVDIRGDEIFLVADPHRLAQVLSNLLNNAAKYTPAGGQIELVAERTGESVTISVTDTGIGIPADKLDHIFEMFGQVDRPQEKGYTGLGIGLTLVKSLVEMHCGSVHVQSGGSGRGSTFTVRLPILTGPQADDGDLGEATGPLSAPASCRVLVVDDNEAAAKMLSMVIKALGNDVRTARDGQEAIELAAEFRPDVMFMDLGMPRMNGYEAARYLRRQTWGTSIVLIALTGWGQDEDKRRTCEVGFDHHLVKPPEPSVLQDLLARVGRDAGR